VGSDDALQRAGQVYDRARREDRELTPAEVAEMERYLDEMERERDAEHDRQTLK